MDTANETLLITPKDLMVRKLVAHLSCSILYIQNFGHVCEISNFETKVSAKSIGTLCNYGE